MTDFLPIRRAAANRKSMQGRLISFFVMLAILFGSIVVPATAQAEDIVASHGSDIMVVLEHGEDADHGDSHEQDGDAPCHAVSHHHCSIALAVDASALKLGFALRDAGNPPFATSAMSSFSQAPPTEPPAA